MSIQNSCASAVDEDVEKLVENVAEEEELESYQIKIAEDDMNGNGYLGLITGLQINGRNQQGTERTLNLIIKSAPKNDALRSQVPIASVFGREIYAYCSVFPALRRFEIEKGVIPSSFTARFYKAQMKNGKEALILENLKSNGFKLHETKILMNDEHLSLITEQYGRFHAISLAMKHQQPKIFDQVIKSMDDAYCKCMKQGGFIKTFKKQCIKAKKSLDPNTYKNELKIYQRFIDEVESFFDEIDGYADEYSVALHGDCWMNNMMFKYDDEVDPGKPTEVRFLDFQLMKYGCAMLDFSNFFYMSASKEAVSNDLHYLRLYYNSLSAHLKKLGGDPDLQYPFSIVEKHHKRFARLGLILSSSAAQVMLTEKDQRKNLNDVSESGQSINDMFDYEVEDMEEFYDRVRHHILHFLNSGLTSNH